MNSGKRVREAGLEGVEFRCEIRRAQGIDGPLFLGKDTHALSGPAQRTALHQRRGRREADPGAAREGHPIALARGGE